jgi:hypothetical protein
VEFEYFSVENGLERNVGRQQDFCGADAVLNGEVEYERCRTNDLHQLALSAKYE